MSEKLRRVVYSLPVDDFDPDEPFDENAYSGEELNGFFHCWTDELMREAEIPYVEKVALVEGDDGKIYRVRDCKITFIEKPDEL